MKNVGATLIELIIAVMFISGTLVSITLLYPRVTSSISNNRQQWLATDFATSKMRELQESPYAVLVTNPKSAFSTPQQQDFPTPGCDCSQENLVNAAFLNSTLTEGNLLYAAYACINLVDKLGKGAVSYCADGSVGPAGADKGAKRILMRIQWVVNGQTKTKDLEGGVTR